MALVGIAVIAGSGVMAAERVGMKVPLKAQPFPLTQVRLLDGPFKHAMEVDRQYLLSLDVDRLLHDFRVNAKLPSTAQPLGGWEDPKCELRGHFVGHYLSACALMYSSTGDVQVKEKADQVVAGLAKCQEAMGNGYLSAFPESFIDRVEACKPVWAPWYTLHKIYAGLIDMHQLCGNRQALEVAKKAADWIQKRADRLSDDQMQKMLGNEHGGMNDVLAELAAVTGDPKYLKLAQRFNHHNVLDPLARREDKLTGLHANTQFPKILGAARQYELTGDENLRTITTFFWDVVTKERSYCTGGNSDGEHFTKKGELTRHLSPTTTETCNTYNMRKITRKIFCWEPKAEYADYDECALYNHILGSQNPEDGMVCYYVPLKNGQRKFSTPLNDFWCCSGTGVENHAKYGDSIYFHDGGKSLYVNLFLASELSWPEKGVTLRQETRYPEEDKTRLTFKCDKPLELDLLVRHPAWATQGIRISINGKSQSIESKPGSYAHVSRVWNTGDTLELSMPMSLRVVPLEGVPHRVAIAYGPVVLCGELKSLSSIPVICAEDANIVASVQPAAGQPLVFTGAASVFKTVEASGDGQPVKLIAFYKKAKGPYTVYWDTCDAAGWQKRVREHEAQLAEEKAFESRIVDKVLIGDGQSEQEHKFKGAKTHAGEFNERHYRDAAAGWFSYEVKVLADKPVVLNCVYWGSDIGNREFDVLVDGKKIASQKLEAKHRDQFFDENYVIPAELTKGKNKVAVKFVAAPEKIVGGVFGLRILRKE